MIITESNGGELNHVSQYIPFSRENYKLMIDTLREHDVLTLFNREIDAYNHMLYIEEEVQYGTQCTVLIDLNMLINILSVVSEDHDRDERFVKLGAAFILFAKLSNILIEPFYALNESPEKAEERLLLFQRIDNANEDHLIMVLTGQWQHIPDESLPILEDPVTITEEFPIKLRGTYMTTVTLTKFAALCRSGLTPDETVKALIKWMHEEYIHEHTVAILAIYQLAAKTKKQILKKVKSPKLPRVYKEIDNAIGDLLLLRYWINASVESQNNDQLFLLATADKSLLDLARITLYATSRDVEMESLFKQRIMELWGEERGNNLSEFYLNIKQDQESLQRISNQSGFDASDKKHLAQVNYDLSQTFKN